MSETGLERAQRLAEEGYEAFKSGDSERSRELNLESLEVARETGDPAAVVGALAGLMRVGLRERDFAAVERLAAEAEEAAAGDAALRRLPLHMQAEAARMAGALERARGLYDESIALNRGLGNEPMVAVEQGNKAWVEIAAGDADAAEELVRAGLAGTEDDDAYGLAFGLLGLARIALVRGDPNGVTALGASATLLERAGLVWDPAEEPEFHATVALGQSVARDRFDDLFAKGDGADARSF
jgi:ATP/maltotriose-dependent transcriptional regulator MalT